MRKKPSRIIGTLYWLSVVALIVIRLNALNEIRQYRETPIEIDDAYSYLYQAALLENDSAYEKPLLQSFKDLKLAKPHETWRDLYNNRIYHRYTFYHAGHAYLTLALKKITGLSYEKVWWILTYLFNALLMLGGALFIKTFFSKNVALFGMGLYGFSYLQIGHHFTAAPREWSSLFFIFSLIYLVKILFKQKNTLVNQVFLLASLFFCFSSHTLGKLYLAQITGCLLFVYFIFKTISRKQLICTLSFVFCAIALHFITLKLYSIPSFPKIPQMMDPDMSLVDGLKVLYSKTFGIAHHLSPFHQASSKGFIGFSILFSLIGSFFIWRKKRKHLQLSLFIPLILSALVIQYIMHFLVQDFRPATRYYYFGDYTYTVWLLLVSTFISFGLVSVVHKILPRFIYPLSAIIAAYLIFTNYQTKKEPTLNLIKGFQTRHNDIKLPKKIIETYNLKYNETPSCLQFYGEAKLFMYLTYGDYEKEISYHPVCPSDPKKGFQTDLFYSNSIDPKKCDYTWVSKQETCKEIKSSQVIIEDSGYLLLQRNR